MKYVMEQELVDAINAQRAEAIEFSKQPNCWMGMYIEPSEIPNIGRSECRLVL